MTFAACSDDEDSSSEPKPDSGTPQPDNYVPPSEAGVEDAPADAKPGETAKAILVNGALDVGPFRVCLSYGEKDDLSDQQFAPLPPLPDTANPLFPIPALFEGTGGPLPKLNEEPKYNLVPYLVSATRLAAAGQYKAADGGLATEGGSALKPCGDILAPAFGLVEGVDYQKLAVIPKNTLKPDTTTVMVVTGCTKKYAGDATKCGPGWTNTAGNVKLQMFVVDRTGTVPPKTFGAQFIHAASAVPAKLTADAGLIPAFVKLSNPGPDFVSAAPVPYGQIAPKSVNPVTIPGDGGFDYFGFGWVDPDGGTQLYPLPVSLIETISGNGPPLPTIFSEGNRVVMVAVGDPTEPLFINPNTGEPATEDGGVPNLKTLHFLSFPNNPTVADYKP